MKKALCVLLCGLLLAGCGAEKTLETVTDNMEAPVMAQRKEISVTLPQNAAVETLDNGAEGKIYLCDGYTVTVQVLTGGDTEKTFRELTGFSKDQLTVVEREAGDYKRYDCVWSSVGEAEDCVARGTVLDDGFYHYAVTVSAPFSAAGDLAQTWQSILSSVSIG
ncbi:MAG: hypothetical protein IKJ94_03435 [Oscillospiraceae bacterium]|nr:hypothetical protein [Oscillospiraceae bacterium]